MFVDDPVISSPWILNLLSVCCNILEFIGNSMITAHETTYWKMHSPVKWKPCKILMAEFCFPISSPLSVKSFSYSPHITHSDNTNLMDAAGSYRNANLPLSDEDILRSLCWNNYITGWNYRPSSLHILPNGSDFPLREILLRCTNSRLPLRWCNHITQCKANSLYPF